ncbi:extracellular solute-binding protein [Georgenia halophila]|uniref:Extracellular solute-binding protein n=1 Tax=Georgenia halophila TaxID=620889 RepID=A0ABP8LNA3_9MICO
MTPYQPGPSRRTVLGAGLLGLAAPVLGSCARFTGDYSSGQSVRFWNLFSGGDGVLLEEILAEITPIVGSVHSTVLEWGQPYYTKLAMASTGGRGPDLAILHLSRLPGYAPGGLLEPFDLDLLAEFGIRPEDFDQKLWSRGVFDGEQRAIPMDTHPFISFYQREPLDAAGMLTTDGVLREFEGGDDFLAALDELHATSGLTPVSFGHINHDSQAWRIFWSLLSQQGTKFELGEGVVDIDVDGVERVMAFLGQLFDGTRALPNQQSAASEASFVNGRSAMHFNGEWELTTFRDAEVPDLGASPFPTILGEPAGAADSHSFVLPAQLAADEAKRREAHQFVAEFLKASITWAEAGHIPAYTPVTQTSEYQQLEPQRDYVQASETAALDPQAWFTGSGSEFQREAGFPVQNAILGGDPARAADELVRYCEQRAAEPNPTTGGVQ